MACDGKYGIITAEKKQFHPGEPVFLIRATDPAAAETIEHYAAQCKLRGCSDEHIAACEMHAARIATWQADNPDLVKVRAD